MFLATTALEEFWNKDEKILFLGEWCKLYDRKEELEKLEYKTLDFEWNDLEQQKDAMEYCNKIYEKILEDLVIILNSYHNINEDKKYWRLLLSSWLLPFIQVIYDKYTHIKKALQFNGTIHTYTLDKSQYYTPIDFNDFMHNIAFSDIYNLQLYSQIFKSLSSDYKDIYIEKENLINAPSSKYNLKEILLRFSTNSLNKIFQQNSILITNPSIKRNSLYATLKLLFKSKFLFVFDNMKYDIKISEVTNIQKRYKLFTMSSEKSFEKLLYDIFIYNFPIVFLEGYKKFDENIDKLNFKISNLVFTSNALHGNDIFKFFVAKNKIKLLYKQHGGGYGLDFFVTVEKIERDASYVYFTNGWTDNNKTKSLPINEIKPIFKTNKTVNFVMTCMPRYVYKFNFAEDSSKMLCYIKNSQLFLSNLKSINNLVIRTYTSDYKWNIKERLLDVNKDLKFDNRTDYYKQISSARLNIFDHMHTGYLESLSMNKPTIIIIPKNIYYFRDSAKSYIQSLINAKILFENPIEAANFVDEIYENIDSWWLSDEVQKIKNAFCYQYARTSENWTDEWVKEFNKILEEDARN